MPHQCIHCGKVYPDAASELLKGCTCGAKFFFYIKQQQMDALNQEKKEFIQLGKQEKEQVEKDVRDMTGIKEEEPVILDLESVEVIKPGKFQIDIINLFNKKRPVIFKLEEGKYIIDLASTLGRYALPKKKKNSKKK